MRRIGRVPRKQGPYSPQVASTLTTRILASQQAVLVVPTEACSMLASGEVEVDIAALADQPAPQAGAGYLHVQDTPSTVWIVQHNLNLADGPLVQVRTVDGHVLFPEIVHVDANTLHVNLQPALAGTVRCL